MQSNRHKQKSLHKLRNFTTLGTKPLEEGPPDYLVDRISQLDTQDAIKIN